MSHAGPIGELEKGRRERNAKLTVYPDMAHNSWERAFADDEMWKWMFSQKRG